MSVGGCLIKMRELLKDRDEDLAPIPKGKLEQFARRLEAAGADTWTKDQFNTAAKNMVADAIHLENKQDRVARLMSLSRLSQITDHALTNASNWIEEGTGRPEEQLFEAARGQILGGSNRPGVGVNYSLSDARSAIVQPWREEFARATESVKKTAISDLPQFKRDTFMALDALDNGQPLGKWENTDALTMARAMRVVREKIFQRMKFLNPYLGTADQYLWKQMWEPENFLKAGEGKIQNWSPTSAKPYAVNRLMGALDLDKSFPGCSDTEIRAILSTSYDRIVTGTHGTVLGEAQGDGGNLLAQTARSRQWIFKDAKSFADMQAEFGPNTLAEGVDRLMRRASSNVAQLEKWGPNAQTNFDSWKRALVSAAHDPDSPHFHPEAAQYLKSREGDLDSMFRMSMGGGDTPANNWIGKASEALNTIEYLSKAGFGAIRHGLNAPMGAAMIKDVNGQSVFTNAARIATEFAKSVAPYGHAADSLSDFNLMARTAWEEHMGQLGAPAKPGLLGAASKLMGTVSGANRALQAVQAGYARVLGASLGRVSDTEFSQLEPRFQQALSRYEISQHDWNLARQATEQISGRKMVTMDAIRGLSDAQTQTYASNQGFKGTLNPATLNNFREQVATKLGVMFNEQARLTAGIAGESQKSWALGGTNINTTEGALRSCALLFKNAALVGYDNTKRAYMSGAGPQGDLAGSAGIAVLGVFLYTMYHYSTEMMKGKTPEAPDSIDFATHMMAGSGATGIGTELLMNSADKNGLYGHIAALAEGIAGPALTDITTAGFAAGMKVFGDRQAKREGTRALTAQAVNMVPFSNLFYTKAAYDYYLGNEFREFMGPGFLGSLNRWDSKTPGLWGDHQERMFFKPGTGERLF